MKSCVVLNLTLILVSIVRASPIGKFVLSEIDWSNVQLGYLVPDDLNDYLHENDLQWKNITKPMVRIVGGQISTRHSLPYQVGLALFNSPSEISWCGGSLISNRFVLTAAHCVENSSRGLVFVGANNIRDSYEAGRLLILVGDESFIIHENWNRKEIRNDIALIKLPFAVRYSDKVQPIALPSRSQINKSFEGSSAVASGWGRFSDKIDNISTYLQYVSLSVLPEDICQNHYGGSFHPENICVSGENYKSVCEGDSGGPLVLNENGFKFIIGLTSFGSAEGCQKGWPSVSTRITSYLDWISQKSGI